MVDIRRELWIEARLGVKSGRAQYYYNANTLQVRHTAPSPEKATVISQDDLIFSFVSFLYFYRKANLQTNFEQKCTSLIKSKLSAGILLI